MLDILAENEMKNRRCDITDIWAEHPEYVTIAQALQKILGDSCWRFSPVFAPEDDYFIIGQVLTGDLCEIEAVRDVEEKYGVTLFVKRDFHPVLNSTMLDVVKYIHENRTIQATPTTPTGQS